MYELILSYELPERAQEMVRVTRDHDYTVITRPNHESVVPMSLADLESWRETAYLLSSPANAKRLSRAIEQLDAGGPGRGPRGR